MRKLMIIVLSMGALHLAVFLSGNFSVTAQSTGTGIVETINSNGASCDLRTVQLNGEKSNGSASLVCTDCYWVTYEFVPDNPLNPNGSGYYVPVDNRSTITYVKHNCVSGAQDDTCLSSEVLDSSCPESEEEPPNTGTDTGTGTGTGTHYI